MIFGSLNLAQRRLLTSQKDYKNLLLCYKSYQFMVAIKLDKTTLLTAIRTMKSAKTAYV